MRSESKVTLENAARILGTDIHTLLDEIWAVGIDIQHDKGIGVDFISAEDLEDLRESLGGQKLTSVG